ncbi:MAG: endo alpha-1,4 polygalactosaminidase [Oleispira sp.]
MNHGIRSTLLIFASLSLASCCDISDDENDNEGTNMALAVDVPAETVGNWYQPAVLTSWHWQLEGALNTGYSVDVYDIDLFDSSKVTIEQLQLDHHKVICYFSAGSYENWRDDKESFSATDYGRTLDGWEGERWLDIRSANVHSIMLTRLDLAVSKGCDGVEPDNMDGYSNASGFTLTADDQLAYNRYLANQAHLRGLSIGLKNDLDQIAELVEYYDFAVNEQCFEYQECEALAPFTDAGKAIFNAEYADIYVNDATARNTLCVEAMNLQMSSLILPLDLDDSIRLSCL